MPDNSKSQAGSFAGGPGGKERLKNLVHIFGRNTAAVVGEPQFYVLTLYDAAYSKLAFRFARSNVDGVVDNRKKRPGSKMADFG